MSNMTYLEFEQSLSELDKRIRELRATQDSAGVDISAEIQTLEEKSAQQMAEIYARLTPWQVSQVSRHPQRPYTLDYIRMLFTEFHELHGDRGFADDPAIVAGLARFEGQSVVVIGHQKGRDLKERTRRNFGMPRPEGYRKAERVMLLAEKFRLPVLTFIDTPGAYPGVGAEERGQSEAIGRNLFVMAGLRTPIIATVIGEGGSGGALAIAVADQVNMLAHSTYSVISPEGCASILWKSAAKAPDAAVSLGITAERLQGLGLIDTILPEPVGGAHRAPESMAATLRDALRAQLAQLAQHAPDALVDRRQARLRAYGRFDESQAA